MGNALFIVWRESAEAMLVVGILYAWLKRRPDAAVGLRYLWGGVAAGVGLALALAIVMLGVASGLSDDALEYFQVAMMLIAAGLIVQMVFWMRRHGRTFKKELEAGMRGVVVVGFRVLGGAPVLLLLLAFVGYGLLAPLRLGGRANGGRTVRE